MRSDQWATYVTVDGVAMPAPGETWDMTSGGDIDSEEVKYRPGGMQPEIALGGPQTISTITVTKHMVLASDWDAMRSLLTRAGKAQMAVIRQPLDSDGNAFGKPITFSGRLKTITPPEANSTANAAATWALVCSCQTAV